MKKRQLLSLVFLSVMLLFSSRFAIAMGDMKETHKHHDMSDMEDTGDMMEDEWCKNDPAIMHKMGKHMMNKVMNPFDMIREKLNLSDEENKKLGTIFYEYRKEKLRKKTEITNAEMDL